MHFFKPLVCSTSRINVIRPQGNNANHERNAHKTVGTSSPLDRYGTQNDSDMHKDIFIEMEHCSLAFETERSSVLSLTDGTQ